MHCHYCDCVVSEIPRHGDHTECAHCGARINETYTELRGDDIIVAVYQVGERHHRDRLDDPLFDTEKAIEVHQEGEHTHIHKQRVSRSQRSRTFRGQDELNVHGFNFHGEMMSDVLITRPSYVRIGHKTYEIVDGEEARRIEAVDDRDSFSSLGVRHY